MHIITLKLPLINNIELQIKNKQLAEFTARQLKNYIINTYTNNENTKEEFVITVSGADFLNKIEKVFNINLVIGRSHVIKKNEIVLPKFKYIYTKSNLKIKSDSKIKWYKKIRKFSYRKCNMQFYENILYPIFSLYTMLDNYILVHGSLLQIKNKNVIISGLDGVGKSSLSDLLTQSGAKLFADNFVLFNGIDAVPINLPMRLYDNQNTKLEVIYCDKQEKLKEVLPRDKQYSPLKIDEIYFLNMANELSFELQTLNNPMSWFMICNIAPEICNANTFISIFLYKAFCEEYFNNFKFYNLSIPKGKLEEGVRLITNEH